MQHGTLVRFFYSTLFFALFVTLGFSQIQKPVKWSFSAQNTSTNIVEVRLEATIEKGWHMYAINPGSPDVIPTSFTFSVSPSYVLVDSVVQGIPITRKEPVFDNAELNFFEDHATFTQNVQLKSSDSVVIKGSLEFMVCSDNSCLPPEIVEFAIPVSAGEKKNGSSEITSTGTTKSNTLIFILGFLGGLAALLTPCVFPMIPLTVSFFTKQGNGRSGLKNALIYSFSIIIIYIAIGFLVTVSLGPDALNALSSNEWMNLLFFIIFVVFGISFLGAFEITLPSSWVNKADKASEKGGLIGIFFMAFTLSLVSFSCTGPIIGSLLVEASVGGNYMGPLTGMLGFSVALALPFGLFAAFPQWLNSLPKSGGWLNNVKVVLGLLEIAFALKFLSIVDLAGLHIDFLNFHINGPIGFLKRELFLSLWIVIFTLLGFYLLGKIRFSHDSLDTKYVSIPKFLFAVLAFSFVVYLVPGLWGAPLKLISGFPPPSFHSEGWGTNSHAPAVSTGPSTHANTSSGQKHIQCPHGLNCFHDYSQALDYAKQVNKPLLVDFTGWACVNCRKMEENVWIDPAVMNRLQNEYVLVSLYVDDKTPLPEAEQYISTTTGKKIKTIGNKWSDFQTERFKTNSQPWYVILNHEEQELIPAQGYNPNIPEFEQFLDAGIKAFKK
ncbi:MAG: thioredoxin family protein [Bacteroidetes bacterium]|nr:thioredoxin family protein [Bacteroidota bacterium]